MIRDENRFRAIADHFLFGLLGTLGWVLLDNIYTNLAHSPAHSWLGGIGILILVFVLYRNKLQFVGWLKDKTSTRLSRPMIWILVMLSLVLIILPFLI